jgi:dihydrolipoamide dehydrogenase
MVMGEATLETQVAIIGGGPGGYAAAFRAADLGLDVTLIDVMERPGGVCLFRGCIPSKALLHLAEVDADVRRAAEMGLRYAEREIELEGIRAWKDGVVDRLTKGLMTLTKQRDIQFLQGRASFEESGRLLLQNAQTSHIKFEHLILATGSGPIPLPGTEFREGGRVMDSKAALDLPDIPETLLVVGGGYIGLELGMVYASLGTRVTMVEMLDGLLPSVDRDLVRHLARRAQKVFEAIHLETKVAELEEREDNVRVTLEGDVEEPEQTFDRVLVAIGRRPNSDGLGLGKTEVALDEDGFIIVDEAQRTTHEGIWAIGDVAGQPLLAHKAMQEGKVAAGVIAGEPEAFDARCIPAVVYTDPQIAWCGLAEAEAKEKGYSVKTGRFPWQAAGRAVTMGEPEGLTKLVFDMDSRRILGAGIVGRRAEDLIAEAALAIEMGALADDIGLTIHPHPTLSETMGEAAEAFLGQPIHIVAKRR